MRAVALDVGERWIGVAVTDPLGWTARPYSTLQRRSRRETLKALGAIIAEREAEVLVVGLPLNMDGSEGPRAAAARRLAAALEPLGLPVRLVDERLSSLEAEAHMRRAGVARRDRRLRRDAFAAAVILQRFLDEGGL